MKRQYNNLETIKHNKKYKYDDKKYKYDDKKRKNITNDFIMNKKIKETEETIYNYDIIDYSNVNVHVEYTYII
jgi:hypothetical protein